ncbi:MAG: hypothetical protein AAF799_14615 [Myxococcota bacterium]
MTLVDTQGRPRVTTRILRILQAGEHKSLYVQTRNSVYQLCPSPLRPEDDLHTQEDTSSTG